MIQNVSPKGISYSFFYSDFNVREKQTLLFPFRKKLLVFSLNVIDNKYLFSLAITWNKNVLAVYLENFLKINIISFNKCKN